MEQDPDIDVEALLAEFGQGIEQEGDEDACAPSYGNQVESETAGGMAVGMAMRARGGDELTTLSEVLHRAHIPHADFDTAFGVCSVVPARFSRDERGDEPRARRNDTADAFAAFVESRREHLARLERLMDATREITAEQIEASLEHCHHGRNRTTQVQLRWVQLFPGPIERARERLREIFFPERRGR